MEEEERARERDFVVSISTCISISLPLLFRPFSLYFLFILRNVIICVYQHGREERDREKREQKQRAIMVNGNRKRNKAGGK